MLRTVGPGISLLVLLSLPGLVHADGAPMPIEAGEFFVRAGAGYQFFRGPDYESLRMFKDDSAFNMGLFTLIDDEGYLLRFDTRSEEVVPEIAIGWGITDSAFGGKIKGVVRLEASAFAHKREATGFLASATPPSDGFFVIDPGTGLPVEVGLYADFGPIDGRDENADGSQAGFLTNFRVEDINFEMETRSAGGELMLYLDERMGNWLLTRGAGLVYIYQDQTFDQDFALEDGILTLPGVNATTGGDLSYLYDYDLRSDYIWLKFGFSAGREFLRSLTLFLNGSFAGMYAHSRLTGSQEGLCFSTCQVAFIPLDLSRGTIGLGLRKGAFAYDLRAAGGLSLRLWKVRLTGQVGVDYASTFFRPFERGEGGGIRLDNPAAFSFFGKASITISFP